MVSSLFAREGASAPPQGREPARSGSWTAKPASADVEPGNIRIHFVEDTAALAAALAIAEAGDRIELAPGPHDGLTISGHTFAQPVTIASADPDAPAWFAEPVLVSGVHGLTIDGVDMRPDAVLPSGWAVALDIVDSTAVTLSDMVIAGRIPGPGEGAPLSALGVTAEFGSAVIGHGFGRGVLVEGSADVRLEEIEVTGFTDGVLIVHSDRVTVSGAHFHRMSSDGVKLGQASDIVIEDSLFESFFLTIPPEDPGRAAHPDFIQFWIDDRSARGVDGLTIRGNAFVQGEGTYTQGVFARSLVRTPQDPPLALENIRVHDNLFHMAQWNALWITDARDIELSHNTILPAEPSPGMFDGTTGVPRLVIGGTDPGEGFSPTRDQHVHHNVTVGMIQNFPDGGAAYMDANNIRVDATNRVLSTDPASADYWGALYPDLVGVLYPRAEDFAPGGPAGAREIAPTLAAKLDALGDRAPLRVWGTEGDDLLVWNDPVASRLHGGPGADTLTGGPGADILDPGPGDDRMTGGTGADNFRLVAEPGGTKTITDLDFDEGDWITLIGGFPRGFFASVTDAETGNRVVANRHGTGVEIVDIEDLRHVAAHPSVTAEADGPDATALRFDLDGDTRIDWTIRLEGITGIGEDRSALDPITGGPGDDTLTALDFVSGDARAFPGLEAVQALRALIATDLPVSAPETALVPIQLAAEPLPAFSAFVSDLVADVDFG